MTLTFIENLATEDDMQQLAGELARAIPEGAFIYLNGPLGAGKTTFVRGFLRSLGYQDKVKSPTYTLVESYDIAKRLIYHFDLYRIADPKELKTIDLYDYFSPAHLCLVEWPELGGETLPPADLVCYIRFVSSGREIRIESHSSRGTSILKQLMLYH